ncbi:MAG: hypothetical protein H0U58_09810 [Chloroflexi bacterium]|nr:hypothetical protein [Chloroflexota bacterium]
MTELRPFRPARIFDVLMRHEVRYVLIGGLAAQAHGSPSLTGDLDLCFARDAENLSNLADALLELGAVRRDLPPDSPKMPALDARTLLAGGAFTLATRFGDVDLLASPDPGFHYERLLEHAVSTMVDKAPVAIASLDDLMAMKRAAGRPKDRIELEILGALREELDRRQ